MAEAPYLRPTYKRPRVRLTSPFANYVRRRQREEAWSLVDLVQHVYGAPDRDDADRINLDSYYAHLCNLLNGHQVPDTRMWRERIAVLARATGWPADKPRTHAVPQDLVR